MQARGFRVIAVSLAVMALLSAAWTECVCATVKASGNGWCSDCKQGYVFGQKTSSKKVFDAMQGQPKSAADMEKCACKHCKEVYAKDGVCEICKVRWISHVRYSSNVAAALAIGKPVPKDEHDCANCEVTVKDAAGKPVGKLGWCAGCKVGYVAGRVYSTREQFDAAKHASDILKNALTKASKCEECAVAMLTDDACVACKVSYKDGEVVKAK